MAYQHVLIPTTGALDTRIAHAGPALNKRVITPTLTIAAEKGTAVSTSLMLTLTNHSICRRAVQAGALVALPAQRRHGPIVRVHHARRTAHLPLPVGRRLHNTGAGLARPAERGPGLTQHELRAPQPRTRAQVPDRRVGVTEDITLATAPADLLVSTTVAALEGFGKARRAAGFLQVRGHLPRRVGGARGGRAALQ